MKKRNPIAVFGLSIITLGIYDLYWLHKTRQELNKTTRTKVPTIWLLFVPAIIFIVALIAFIIVVAGAHNTSHTVVSTYNNQTTTTTVTTNTSNGTGLIFLAVYVIAAIATFLISFYWFFKFSKAVNEYTNGKSSTGVTFLLLWVLHLIGVAVVQDTFNDMIDSGQVPGMAASAMPAPATAGIVTNGPAVANAPGQPPLVTPATPAPAAPAVPVAPNSEATPQPPVQPEASVTAPAATVISPDVASPGTEVPTSPVSPSSDSNDPASPTVQS